MGGERRTVSAGDVVVIPAGVLHGWVEIPEQVRYLSIRPDPDRVLPAGYVNPAMRSSGPSVESKARTGSRSRRRLAGCVHARGAARRERAMRATGK